MNNPPTIFEVLIELIKTPAGKLIVAGLIIILAVFLLPLLFKAPEGWRNVEKRILISDWAFSLGFTCLGAGFLFIESQVFRSQAFMPLSYRLGLSGLFFAIAGRKVYLTFR